MHTTGIGARLKMARRLAGLSQQEVAGRMGITKMAVSKYENEAVIPGSGVLIRLANALGQPVEFLLRGPVTLTIEPVYRCKADLTGPREEAVKAQLLEWLERYLAAESLYPADELPHYRRPAGFPRMVYDFEAIESAADALREEWGFGDDPIENLTESLEDRGVKVGLVDGNDSFDACQFALPDGAPVIAVKGELPGERRRFSLAHELGHLMLHSSADLDAEKAAHRFAGALLAPRTKVYLELGSRRSRLDVHELHLLKHKYGMSMKAWVHRAADLGIIGESAARSHYIQFSASGWNRVEPGDALPAEKPQRLLRLVLRALNEGVIARARAEELLGKSWETFQQEQREEHGELIAAVGN